MTVYDNHDTYSPGDNWDYNGEIGELYKKKYERGTLSNRPTAADAPDNAIWHATDQDTLYRNDPTNGWVTVRFGAWPVTLDGVAANGSSLTGIDATVTGTTDEVVRFSIEDSHLYGAENVYIEAARTAAGGGESVDIELRNVTDATTDASLTLGSASERTRSSDISGSLTAGKEYKIRANVTSAAGSGTFDVNIARLVME